MIKNTFNPGNYSQQINIVLLLLRLAAGSFMLTHGIAKLSKLFGDDPIKFADPIGVGVTTSLALTVFAEAFCSLFLILGIATRLASIPLIITMFVIVFIVNSTEEFGDVELPLLYLVIYIGLAIAGAGKYSLDNMIYKKTAR
ncbi:MAG: DoxX family protein [Bacteroidota bacterium]